MNIHAIIELVEQYGEACADIADSRDPHLCVEYLNARDQKLAAIHVAIRDVLTPEARLVAALRESFTDTELRDLTDVLESAEYALDAVTVADQSWPLRVVAAINAARIAA